MRSTHRCLVRKLIGALVLSAIGLTLAWPQAKGVPAMPVTQEQLNAAARDEINFLHTNGNYDQTRQNGRGVLALQTRDGSGHDLVLRPYQSGRRRL
jgi:hypothetical protein